MKRATIKLKTPNPLFEKWITEWIEETINSGNIAKSNILTNVSNWIFFSKHCFQNSK